jgi:hypothetical protein
VELFRAIDSDPNYTYIDIKDIIFYWDEPMIRLNFICLMTGRTDMNIPDSRVLVLPGIDFVKLLDPYTELATSYVKWHRNTYKMNIPETVKPWYMGIILGAQDV